MSRTAYIRHLWRDFFILIGGIFIAILLVQLGVIGRFIEKTSKVQIFARIVSGMIFN